MMFFLNSYNLQIAAGVQQKHVLCAGNSKEWLLSRTDGDVQRRRSWTALEDLSSNGDKRKSDRQRRY